MMLVRMSAGFYFYNSLVPDWFKTIHHLEEGGGEWIELTSDRVTNALVRESLETFRLQLEARRQ